MIPTMIARGPGRLYHSIPSWVILGVREYTRPFISSSVFICLVAMDIIMVTIKAAENANMAVQKFWAISLGYVCRTDPSHPPLISVSAPAGAVSP